MPTDFPAVQAFQSLPFFPFGYSYASTLISLRVCSYTRGQWQNLIVSGLGHNEKNEFQKSTGSGNTCGVVYERGRKWRLKSFSKRVGDSHFIERRCFCIEIPMASCTLIDLEYGHSYQSSCLYQVSLIFLSSALL